MTVGADIRISLLDTERDDPAYSDFLNRHEGATIYQSLRYRNVIAAITKARAEYAVAWFGNEIVGALPVMALNGPHGEVLNSLPFFGSYGDVLASDAKAADALVEWFAARLKKPGVAAATIIENPFDRGQHPAWSDRDLRDQRIAQWTELPDEPNFPDALLARIDSSARRNVRRALGAGITVAVDNDAFNFLAQSHCQNMEEIGGRPKPAVFFDAVRQHMIAGEDYRIYIARHDNTTIAVLLMFYFKTFAEYIMPTTLVAQRVLQPTAAILHRAMCDAQAEGRRVWNWGGTWLTQEGVYRFKHKWGAQEANYSYHVFVKNSALARQSAPSLITDYPYFYTLPFTALKAA